MTPTKRKYRNRIIFICTPLVVIFALLIGGAVAIKYAPEAVIYHVIKTFWGPELKIEKVTFTKGKIEFTNTKMYIDGEEVFVSPKIEGYYSSILRRRLDEVHGYDITAIVRRNKRDINFASGFTGSRNAEVAETEAKLEKFKSNPVAYERRKAELEQQEAWEEAKRATRKLAGGIPIDKIIVHGLSANYIDTSFDVPIDIKLDNITGYLTFSKEAGMYIDAHTVTDGQDIRYIFDSNKGERFWMHVIAKDFRLKTEYIQYGYVSDKIEIYEGLADVDFYYGKSSKMAGEISFHDLSAKYLPYDEIATNAKGVVKFPGGTQVTLDGTVDLLGSTNNVDFVYDGNGNFDLHTKLPQLTGADVVKYESLAKRNIDLSALNIISPAMHLSWSRDRQERLDIEIDSQNIAYGSFAISEVEVHIVRDAMGNVYFSNLNGILPALGNANIRGGFDFDFDDNGTNINLTTNIFHGTISILKDKVIAIKDSKITFLGDKFTSTISGAILRTDSDKMMFEFVGDARDTKYNGTTLGDFRLSVFYDSEIFHLMSLDSETARVDGFVGVSDGHINIDKININGFGISGKYNTQNKTFDATLDLNEYKGVGGDIAISGTINGKITLTVTMRNGHVRNTQLPNILAQLTYGDGTINIDKLSIQNSDYSDIVISTGNIDISQKKINLLINNNQVNLAEINSSIRDKGISGIVVLNGVITADLERLSFSDVSVRYNNTAIYAEGYKNLKGDDYGINLWSEELDMGLFDIITQSETISDLSGVGMMVFEITDSDANGFIYFRDTNISIPKYYMTLTDINGRINLADKTLSIAEFGGKMGGGNISLSGKIDDFTLAVLETPDLMENLSYEFLLDLERVNYRYSNNFNLVLNSHLNLASNKLDGTLEIARGEVTSLPVNYISMFTILRDFFIKRPSQVVSTSRELGEDFAIASDGIADNLEVDFRFRTVEPISVNIPEINGFVGDIKGGIMANGTISGVGSNNLVLLGDADILGGSFTLNENKFTIESATAAFENSTDYLPKFNPNINVETSVDDDGETINLGISGNLDRLRFVISSNSGGGSSGYLDTLFSSENNITDETTSRFVRMFLNDQLTQTFISPITRKIKRIFRLSQLRIKSSFMNTKSTNEKYSEDSEQEFRFGATLEGEKELYRDILVLVGQATLIDNNTASRQNADNDTGAFKEYDISLQYNFRPNRSIGVGFGRVPDYKRKGYDSESEHNLVSKINYHIDFKFEKKYHSLKDIFKK